MARGTSRYQWLEVSLILTIHDLIVALPRRTGVHKPRISFRHFLVCEDVEYGNEHESR
jgi:hypothetical protein